MRRSSARKKWITEEVTETGGRAQKMQVSKGSAHKSWPKSKKFLGREVAHRNLLQSEKHFA